MRENKRRKTRNFEEDDFRSTKVCGAAELKLTEGRVSFHGSKILRAISRCVAHSLRPRFFSRKKGISEGERSAIRLEKKRSV